MKKLIFLCLLCAAVMLAACGTGSQTAAEPVGTSEATEETIEEKEGETAEKPDEPESMEVIPENSENLTLEKLLEIVAQDAYVDTDFHAFSNGVRDDFDDENALNYYISFSFEYQGDDFTLDVSYMKDADELYALYFRRESNKEMILLYDREGRYPTNTEVQRFLDYAYDIHEDISYEIPEGLTEEKYTALGAFDGGCLLKPDAYEPHGEFCPSEWYAAGSVSRFYVEWRIEWEGDKIAAVHTFLNHTTEEDFGSLSGLCAPAFLIKCNHDLFTISELSDLEEQGKDIDIIEETSDYWYIFLARPEDEFGYVISLNAKNYTKEDAIAFAGTVKYLN